MHIFRDTIGKAIAKLFNSGLLFDFELFLIWVIVECLASVPLSMDDVFLLISFRTHPRKIAFPEEIYDDVSDGFEIISATLGMALMCLNGAVAHCADDVASGFLFQMLAILRAFVTL